MSWKEKPAGERVAAFSAPSWNASWCLHCGEYRREVGFYFAPSNLADAVVQLARSDGARGFFLEPYAANSAKQGYWHGLSREAQSQLMHVACASDFEHVGKKKMVDHYVFFVDFGDGSDSYAPPCKQAWLRWPGLPRLRQGEEAELDLLHQQLALLEQEESST